MILNVYVGCLIFLCAMAAVVNPISLIRSPAGKSLRIQSSLLFVCDVQERFRPLIFRAE